MCISLLICPTCRFCVAFEVGCSDQFVSRRDRSVGHVPFRHWGKGQGPQPKKDAEGGAEGGVLPKKPVSVHQAQVRHLGWTSPRRTRVLLNAD